MERYRYILLKLKLKFKIYDKFRFWIKVWSFQKFKWKDTQLEIIKLGSDQGNLIGFKR